MIEIIAEEFELLQIISLLLIFIIILHRIIRYMYKNYSVFYYV